MQAEKDMICKSFEQDMWLYLDNELPDEKMEYWRSHLKSCTECENLLSETEKLFSEVEENLIDIEDEKFERMIDRTTTKRSFSLLNIFSSFSSGGNSKPSPT